MAFKLPLKVDVCQYLKKKILCERKIIPFRYHLLREKQRRRESRIRAIKFQNCQNGKINRLSIGSFCPNDTVPSGLHFILSN